MRAFTPVVAASLLLATHGAASAAPGDSVYASPGRIVPAGDGARLNLYCMGDGSPTVIFDSGWEDWAPAWAVVQPRIAKWTRACSYDRAGAGFSEAGPMPRTSERIAYELHGALHNAGIAGPYILVGHAFGADNVRAFADRYMPEVAGLVMVEGDADDLEPVDMQEDDHRGNIEYVVQLRACRDAIAQGKPLPMQPERPGRASRTCAQQFFRGLPEAAWSPELNAKLLQIAQSKVAMYDAYISEMEQMAQDEAYLAAHRQSFGSRPIRVLSTGNHPWPRRARRASNTCDTSMRLRLLSLAGSNCRRMPSRFSPPTVRNTSPSMSRTPSLMPSARRMTKARMPIAVPLPKAGVCPTRYPPALRGRLPGAQLFRRHATAGSGMSRGYSPSASITTAAVSAPEKFC